jgi:hypothetical protein
MNDTLEVKIFFPLDYNNNNNNDRPSSWVHDGDTRVISKQANKQ